MKVLQINTTLASGSTGRIMDELGERIIQRNGESFVAYGRKANQSKSKVIKIGGKLDQVFHLLQTRLLDNHGFASAGVTKKFIQEIKAIEPDLIHLHNLHGYYLNIEQLFKFLRVYGKPVIWTLHDCWAYTGHCCYYERVGCEKWKTKCFECPMTSYYPTSLGRDRSALNYQLKKQLFRGVETMHLVCVSKWLKSEVQQSFLSDYPTTVIYNGVDLDIFIPKDAETLKAKYGFQGKKIILGVANIWSTIKGFDDFMTLSNQLMDHFHIILIGLNQKQMAQLPANITGLMHTEDQAQLADYYAMADVFVSLSIAETFGLVIAEAIACGTPAVVYNATAMPELITAETGVVVKKGNIKEVREAIESVTTRNKVGYSTNCRSFAEEHFDRKVNYEKYHDLYQHYLITESL